METKTTAAKKDGAKVVKTTVKTVQAPKTSLTKKTTAGTTKKEVTTVTTAGKKTENVSKEVSVTTHEPSPEQPYETLKATKTSEDTKSGSVSVSESLTKKSGRVTKTTTYTTTQVGSSKKCAGCKAVLGTDDFVIANNKNYHPDCFVCNNCKKKLNVHRFFLVKENCVCEPCNKALKNPPK